MIKIRYNSPVILTFSLVCICAMAASSLSMGNSSEFLFVSYPGFSFSDLLCYFRLISHVAGHADWKHLAGNLSIILLIGPLLEEKYGSGTLLEMFFYTALVTGILNSLFFQAGLMGASGIVFMLILLASFANFKAGELPLTFILIGVLYLGSEVIIAFSDDNVSQFAHILGGVCGAFFGFLRMREK